MTDKLNNALTNIETTYSELVEIANGMTRPVTAKLDEIMNEVSNNINNITVDQMRDYMLRLQLAAFEISEIKEKAAMKADVAEALYDEAYAVKFNSMDGSASAREKLALVEVSSEIASEKLYNLVASLFKSKVDQAHRMVDVLKSLLMSRMQETKFMNIGTDNNISPTTGRQYLNEKM